MFDRLKGVGDKITIEICQMYHYIGFNCIWNDGKDLTLIDKEKDLPDGNPERSNDKENTISSLYHSEEEMIMNCLRCGRTLTNKASAERGYGPGCYKKVKQEEKRNYEENIKEIEAIAEIEGQIFIDEIRKCS